MGLTNFPNGITSFGNPIYTTGGSNTGIAMGRGLGKVRDPINTKVFFVDGACASGNGSGDSWKNAKTTVQDALNAARYNTEAYIGGSPGTSDINYDHDRQCFVFVAPGEYAERLAWSGQGIHLIGLGMPGTAVGASLVPSAPSTFAFAMSGSGCEVANFCVDEGTAVYGVYLAPMEAGCLHDMVILGQGAGTYGVYCGGTALKGTSLLNNVISGYITCGIYAATADGAYAIQGKIAGNNIGSAAIVKGIDIDVLTVYGYVVAHNYINGTSSASIEGSASGLLVCDNWVDRAPSGTLTARDNHYSSAGA